VTEYKYHMMYQYHGITTCCRVLQGVAGCCRVLQGVAGCWCDRIQVSHDVLAPWYCSVLQCVAEGVADCGRVLQCVAVWCRVWKFSCEFPLPLSLSLSTTASEWDIETAIATATATLPLVIERGTSISLIVSLTNTPSREWDIEIWGGYDE